MKTLYLLIPILWLSIFLPAFCNASLLVVEETPESPDLSLRLADPLQERHTSSVNWMRESPTKSAAEAPGQQTLTLPSPSIRPFKVVIDPGHGGKDLGALGQLGILEKELCLRVSYLIKRQLERQGKLNDVPVEVRLSREQDFYLGLRERVRIANEWNADAFVSVHANSSDYKRARGYEVYFLSAEATDAQARKVARMENGGQMSIRVKSDVLSILSDVQNTYHVNESSRLAEIVYQSMSTQFLSNGRGVKQAPFTVLAGTSMPAILVEVGYITNPQEAKLLQKALYLKKLASAISTGVMQYLMATRKLG